MGLSPDQWGFSSDGDEEGEGWKRWPNRVGNDRAVRHIAIFVVMVGTVLVGLLVTGRPSKVSAADWAPIEDALTIAVALLVAMFAVAILRAVTRQQQRPRQTSYLQGPIPGWNQLAIEAGAMAQYAAKQGIAARPEDQATLYKYETLDGYGDLPKGGDAALVARLAAAHADLAQKVKPATPHTIALLADQQGRPPSLPWLGNVRLVRMMVGLSIVLLVSFVGLAISSASEITDVDKLLSARPFGTKVLTAAYLLVAAALGAAFAALRKAFRYIGNLSYDEKYESSYWIRFVQGVMAGLILSILLASILFDGGDSNMDDASATGFRVTLPVLAFVGGFSEDLVFRLLRRIVDALRTLATGSIDDQVEAQAAQLEAEARQRDLTARGSLVASLLNLKTDLPPGATAAAARIDAAILDALDISPVTPSPDVSGSAPQTPP